MSLDEGNVLIKLDTSGVYRVMSYHIGKKLTLDTGCTEDRAGKETQSLTIPEIYTPSVGDVIILERVG